MEVLALNAGQLGLRNRRADLDFVTDQTRLSYRRAAELFEHAPQTGRAVRALCVQAREPRVPPAP